MNVSRVLHSTPLLVIVYLASFSGAKLGAQAFSSSGTSEEATNTLPVAPTPASNVANEPFADASARQQPKQQVSGDTDYHPFNVRVRSYLFEMFGPGAFITTGIQAGIDQGRPLKVSYPPDGFVGLGEHPAHGAVPEWGEGADGYARRYADRYGQYILGTTIRYGLGEALRQDVTYHRCDCTGVLPRVSHALISPLIAHTQSGRAVPSLPTLVSPFLASEIAVKAWYPSRFNTSDALRTSSTVYFTLPLKNIYNEFGRR